MDSPFSKLVFHVPETTVLGWFQRALHHEDPQELLNAEIGGGAYGFDSIFEAIEEHGMSVVRQGEFCLTETVLSPSITRTRRCRVEGAYPRQMVDRTSRRSARRAEGRRARRAAAAPAGRCS